MTTSRKIRPLIAVVGAAALFSPFYFDTRRPPSTKSAPRRQLDLAVDNSDKYAKTTLSIVSNPKSPPISHDDHAKLTAMLANARELMGMANHYINEDSDKAKGFVELATAKFREAKEHLQKKRALKDEMESASSNLRDVGRKTEEQEEERATETDETQDRNLDLSRSMYETLITFPECVDRLFADCLDIVNKNLKDLALSTVEMVVHEKRNIDQAGYNKVVIVTNPEATLVTGRLHDGMVTYPFSWDDALVGSHMLGVDGKWSCLGMTPEACCNTVKESAPNPDKKGNYIECHIFVPFGGIGNPKRNDRVFINLSPDGRVHEAPVIQ